MRNLVSLNCGVASEPFFEGEKIKIDMHVHSNKSHDGFHDIKTLVDEALRKGLDGILICDHNYIHEKKEKFGNGIVLYGAEVSSSLGHMIILGVNTIPTNDSKKLAEWVKEENGIVIPVHPFSFHRSGMKEMAFKIGNCVEKFNGTDPINNFISLFKIKKGIGGSDAHHISEIGLAWTEFPNAHTQEDIFESLRKGDFIPYLSLNPLPLFKGFIIRSMRKIKGH